MANRFTQSPGPVQFDDVQAFMPNFDMLSRAVVGQQQGYDQFLEGTLKNNLDPLAVDIPAAETIRGFTDQLVNAASDTLMEDTSKGQEVMRDGLRRVRKMFSPGGIGHKINTNKKLAMAEFEKIDKSKLPSNLKNLAKRKIMKDYGGVISGFNAFGQPVLKDFDKIALPEYFDLNKAALDLADKVPVHKWATDTGWKVGSDGWLRKQKGTGERVSKQEIVAKITPFLLSDPKAQDFLNFESTLLSEFDPNETPADKIKENRLFEVISGAGTFFERNDVKTFTRDMKMNPMYGIRMRAALDRENDMLSVVGQSGGIGTQTVDYTNAVKAVTENNRSATGLKQDIKKALANIPSVKSMNPGELETFIDSELRLVNTPEELATKLGKSGTLTDEEQTALLDLRDNLSAYKVTFDKLSNARATVKGLAKQAKIDANSIAKDFNRDFNTSTTPTGHAGFHALNTRSLQSVIKDLEKGWGIEIDPNRVINSLDPNSKQNINSDNFMELINTIAQEQGVDPKTLSKGSVSSVSLRMIQDRYKRMSRSIGDKLETEGSKGLVQYNPSLMSLGKDAKALTKGMKTQIENKAMLVDNSGTELDVYEHFANEGATPDNFKFEIATTPMRNDEGQAQIEVIGTIDGGDGNVVKVKKMLSPVGMEGAIDQIMSGMINSTNPNMQQSKELALAYFGSNPNKIGRGWNNSHIEALDPGDEYVHTLPDGRSKMRITRSNTGMFDVILEGANGQTKSLPGIGSNTGRFSKAVDIVAAYENTWNKVQAARLQQRQIN